MYSQLVVLRHVYPSMGPLTAVVGLPPPNVIIMYLILFELVITVGYV